MRLLNVYDWFRERAGARRRGWSLDLERHPFEPLDGDRVGPAAHAGSRGRHRSADRPLPRRRHHRAVRPPRRARARHRRRALGRACAMPPGGRCARGAGSGASTVSGSTSSGAASSSFFIVDSKTMAPFAMSYRRKRARHAAPRARVAPRRRRSARAAARVPQRGVRAAGGARPRGPAHRAATRRRRRAGRRGRAQSRGHPEQHGARAGPLTASGTRSGIVLGIAGCPQTGRARRPRRGGGPGSDPRRVR